MKPRRRGMGMGMGLGLSAGGNLSQRGKFALTFNGIDEYLTRALPTNLLTGTTSDFTSAGSRPTGWSAGSGETWNQTGITGSTSTNVLKLSGTNAYAYYTGLTAGKKYKIRVRWYGDNSLRIGSTSTGTQYYTSAPTSQWNRKEITLVATSANLYFSIASGTVYIDFFNFTEDWKLDLNESYELIKHSINRDFEQTLGAQLVTNGGATGQTDWINPTAGLAQGFLSQWTTKSIISGSGWTGNAQRVEGWTVGNVYALYMASFLTLGKAYNVTFKYRTNVALQVYLHSNKIGDLVADGTIRTFEASGISIGAGTQFTIYGGSSINDYLEIDEFSIREIPNLVTNGTFTGNANSWGLNDLGTYNSNAVDIVGPSISDMYCYSYTFLTGKRYRVSVQIVAYTSGELYGKFGSTGIPFAFGTTTTGVVSADYTVTVGGLFYFDNSTTLIGTIDNIHIYEIPEWTASGNHSCDVSTLNKSGTTGQSLKVTASGAGNTSNCVTLPSANLESCVSGKKYTLQGEARLDASSLTFGGNLLSGDGITGWTAGAGTGSVVGGEYVLSSTSTGYIYRNINITSGKVIKIVLKAKSSGYTGLLRIYHGGTANAVTTSAVDAGYTTYTAYCLATGNQTFYIILLTNYVGDVVFDDIEIYESSAIAPTLTSQLGTKSVTSSALSIVAGTFTKFVLNFEATESEENQDLKLWLSGAGSVYVDNVSLTQAYDRVFAKIVKPAVTEKRALHSFSSTTFAELKANGYLKSSLSDGTTTVANELSQYTAGAVSQILNILNRTDKLYWAVNNVQDAGTTATALGKIIHTAKLNIGANSSDLEKFSGLYGAIVVIRFSRIEGSNFLGTTYRIGQSVTGGGAEVVLWIDPYNASSTTAMLQDYSGTGNAPSAVNMDTTNRVRM